MTKLLILLSLLITLTTASLPQHESLAASAPALKAAALVPDTSSGATLPAPAARAVVASAPAQALQGPDYPVHVSIPAIGLEQAVVRVGLNAKGEMDVPSGNTTDVGWYKNGTVPGELGSAVLDAHVFAAFAKLKELKVGNDIVVAMASGKHLRFVVADARTYALHDVSADELFNRADARRLNLITCAGNLTADHSTYDHRLVVHALLAQ